MVTFSFVTAVRGRHAALLRRPYRSLLNLTGDHPWEWRVVLDGPPSQHADVPTAILKDSRVEVRSAGGQHGTAACRNLALVNASGQWVVPLDGDDELPPEALSLYSQHAEKGLAVISGSRQVLHEDEAGEVRVELEPLLATGVFHGPELCQLMIDEHKLLVHTGAAALRTEVLRAVGGWPGLPLCQDVAVWVSAALQGDVKLIGDVVYRYVRWAGQTTSAENLAKNNMMQWCRTWLAQQMHAGLKLEGVPPTSPTY